MESAQANESKVWNILNWVFWLIFLALGILNFIYIHPVPGIIYLLISLIYLPPLNSYIKEKFNLQIPSVVKIIIAFVVLWFTLGVSDLFELFEKNVL